MILNNIAFGVHMVSLLFTVSSVVYADHEGFSWIRGKKQTLDLQTLKRMHRLVSIGLTLMIASGSVLFWNAHTILLSNPVFYAKMAFVLTLVVNAFVIGKYMSVATTRAFNTLQFREKTPLIISGAVSTISWLSAATAAFFLLD